MPKPKRTTLREIMPVIKQRLIDEQTIGEDRIFMVAKDPRSVPHYQADQDILLWARLVAVDRSWADGSGRVATLLRRHLTVAVRTRLNIDPQSDDTSWITDATLGHYQLEESIPNAFEEWYPTDANGAPLTIEVLQMIDGSEPSKPPSSARGAEQTEDWGYTALRYELAYLLDLDQLGRGS